MTARKAMYGGEQHRRKEESRPDLAPRAAPHEHKHLSSMGQVFSANHNTKGGARQAQSEGFHMVGNEAIRHWLPVLGPNAWAVLSILNTYANHKDRLAWPSLDTLARYTGLNTTTVRASLVILEATGLIARISYREASQYLADDRLPRKRGRPPTIWLVRSLDKLPPLDQQRLEEAIERARAASNQHIGKYIAAFIQRAQVALDELHATVAQKTAPAETEQPRADLPATVAQKYADPPPQSQEPGGDFSAMVAPNLPAMVAHYSELPATVAGNSELAGEEGPERGGDFPATVAGEQKEDIISIEESRLIGSTINNERSPTKSILTYRQQQRHTGNARSEQPISPKPPQSVVVVDNFSSSSEDISLSKIWLQRAGVQEPARSNILQMSLPLENIIGWIIFAATLETLTRNPSGLIVNRLREGVPPPEEVQSTAHAFAKFTPDDLSILGQVYSLYKSTYPTWESIGNALDVAEVVDFLHEILGEEEAKQWLSRIGMPTLEIWVDFQGKVVAARRRHTILSHIRLPWEDVEPPSAQRQKKQQKRQKSPWENVWEHAQQHLKSQMERRDFNTWIKDTRIVQAEQQENGLKLTIGVPHAFAKEWLRNRLHGLVKNAVAEAASRPVDEVDVAYVVDATH